MENNKVYQVSYYFTFTYYSPDTHKHTYILIHCFSLLLIELPKAIEFWIFLFDLQSNAMMLSPFYNEETDTQFW